MPEDLLAVIELYFMAYDFQVLDLMQRCENELINKISAQNVTDILIKLHPHLKRPSKHANVVEDTELL